ncbi:MAG: hypothetical protein JG773_820 [Spirochaeta sp.]|nr:hypothetical protein [Spirochaeta sp.]
MTNLIKCLVIVNGLGQVYDLKAIFHLQFCIDGADIVPYRLLLLHS